MEYHFKIHKEGDLYWAECLEIEGCFSQAESLEALHDAMRQAINLCLQEPKGSRYVAPEPDPSIRSSRWVVRVPVDPAIAFAYLVRSQRIRHGMTQSEVARRLGMKNTYSYQRLETKSNPTLEMIVKLAYLFPDISVDAIFH